MLLVTIKTIVSLCFALEKQGIQLDQASDKIKPQLEQSGRASKKRTFDKVTEDEEGSDNFDNDKLPPPKRREMY